MQVIAITSGTSSEKINFYLLKAFTSDLTHRKLPIAYILLILMPKMTCIIGKASKIGPKKWKIIKNDLKFCSTKKSSLYVPVRYEIFLQVLGAFELLRHLYVCYEYHPYPDIWFHCKKCTIYTWFLNNGIVPPEMQKNCKKIIFWLPHH